MKRKKKWRRERVEGESSKKKTLGCGSHCPSPWVCPSALHLVVSVKARQTKMKWWRRQHGGRRYTNNDNCSGGRRPSKFNKNILFTQKKIMLVFAPGTHVPAPPLPLTLSLFPAPSLSPQTERRKGNWREETCKPNKKGKERKKKKSITTQKKNTRWNFLFSIWNFLPFLSPCCSTAFPFLLRLMTCSWKSSVCR